MTIPKDLAQQVFEILKSAKEFTVEQAPLVVKEVITYNYIICGAWLFVGLIILIIGAIFAWKASRKEYHGEFFWFLGIILPIIGFITAGTNIVELLRIYYTPRMYLLEYFASILR